MMSLLAKLPFKPKLAFAVLHNLQYQMLIVFCYLVLDTFNQILYALAAYDGTLAWHFSFLGIFDKINDYEVACMKI